MPKNYLPENPDESIAGTPLADWDVTVGAPNDDEDDQ